MLTNAPVQLWGNPNHMANMAKALRAQYRPDKLYILVAKRNAGSFTYDGIELGGERVCVEIEEELQVIESKGGKIKKLSVVGYSLGGLVARYAIGLLYAKGVLDTLECMVGAVLLLFAQSLQLLTTWPCLELHSLCEPLPRSAHSPPRIAERRMERPGCPHTVHVRPAAVWH
jgi:hypothetical protein